MCKTEKQYKIGKIKKSKHNKNIEIEMLTCCIQVHISIGMSLTPFKMNPQNKQTVRLHTEHKLCGQKFSIFDFRVRADK